MTREQAVAFFLFSVAAAGTPGPSNVLLTAVGANVGVLRGLPCLLGVGLGILFRYWSCRTWVWRALPSAPSAVA